MILGVSIPAFALIHTVISLIGIASGVIVVVGMLSARHLPGWTALFLTTTVATSVTGFMFPLTKFGPPHIVGLISLVVLAIAIPALYVFHLRGAWRWVYVTGAVLSLYFNVFVGVVQAFQKIPFFNALAPTQTEPPFLVAQVPVLLLFVVLAVLGVRRFHPAMPAAAPA
jgi:hypothetical protein